MARIRDLFRDLALERRDAPAVFTVSSILDSGVGSLRQAVLDASALSGADTIDFSPAMTNQTIRLASEIAINDLDPLSIQGPPNLTLNGDTDGNGLGDTRLVTIGGGADVSIDRIHFTSGNSAAATNAGFGGAINVVGKLNLTRSIVSNSSAWFQGGGVRCGLGGYLTISECTISGNSVRSMGGGIDNSGTTVIFNSTVSENVSGLFSRGGGVSNFGTLGVLNSTISGNSAGGTGGAIWHSGSYLTVMTSTIASNVSRGVGGVVVGQGTKATFSSTIVAGNGIDIDGVVQSSGSHRNLIGNPDTAGGLINGQNGNIVGASGSAVLPVGNIISPLSSNGGLTRTHALVPGSVGINAGSNPLGYATDQRGAGYSRSVGGGYDIGAFERDPQIPTANVATPPAITTPAGPTFQVDVVYTGQDAINAATFDINDVFVSGPTGQVIVPTSFSVDVPGDGSPRTVSYTFAVPGGEWEPIENGKYVVRLNPGDTQDVTGRPVMGDVLATMAVELTGLLTVDSASMAIDGDYSSGEFSLGEALKVAAATPGAAETITFSPALSGSVIRLATELELSTPVVIDGANRVTISGDTDGNGTPDRRLVYVAAGTKVTLERLLLTSGSGTGLAFSGRGGAILNQGQLLLRECQVTASVGGVYNFRGDLNIQGCTIFGNSLANGTGGGIQNEAGTLAVAFSTIAGNTAAYGGGIGNVATSSGNAIATISNSTITGNRASVQGGGVFNKLSASNPIQATVTIFNSTISGNTSNIGGGTYNSGTMSLNQCTVAANGPTSGVGGQTSFTTLNSTIVIGHKYDLPSLAWTAQGSFNLIGTANFAGGLINGMKGNIVGVGGTGVIPMSSVISPLGYFGGSTQTHALNPKGMAVNAGANPTGVATDQRGNGYARVAGIAPDIGAFEIQPSLRIGGLRINDGLVQRSRVTSLKLDFDQAPPLPAIPNEAFVLKRTSDGVAVAITSSITGNTVTLTFAPGPAVEFGSLADGRYTLTVLASQINNGNFDGNGDGVPGDDYVLVGTPANGLFRLFGDSNGDGTVNAVDFLAFRLAYITINSTFDADGDTLVGPNDFLAFRLRYLMSI